MKNRDVSNLGGEMALLYKRRVQAQHSDNASFFILIAVTLVAVLALRLFIITPMRVDGSSMLPALEDKERMLVEKVSYWFNEPQRGDIVVCYYPGSEISRVKRVIGLPGETIEVRGGKVYVNGALLDESSYWNGYIYFDYGPFQVPEGQVFVMGDNRNDSKDSRNPSVGPIPFNRVAGRAIGVVWPIKKARMFV